MNELNEKLAVEVMGWTWDDEKNLWRDADGYGTLGGLDDDEDGVFLQDTWTPTQDLNQLKMCYEALSEDEKTLFSHLMLTSYIPKVFTNPELVAQDILKAKGVS